MNSNYKLVAIDIDGTLLDDHYKCDEETKACLAKLTKQGILVMLCTGRGLISAKQIAEEIGIGSYLATDNGAVLFHIPTQKPLLVHEISREVYNQLIPILLETGVHLDITSMTHMYTLPHSEEVAELYKKYKVSPIIVPSLMDIQDIVIKVTLFAESAILDQVMEDLPSLVAPLSVQCFRSGPYYIDLMHIESSKGLTLRYLADELKMAPDNLIAIGNYFNDLDMIRFAGVGIAMENAPFEVKDAADYVTGSNNHQGVKKALERYFKELVNI